VKGGRKNWDEHETKTTNDTPQEARNNRRTLLITGGKLGCRPLETSVKRTLERIFGEGTADVQRYLPASDLQWTAVAYYGDYPQLHHYQEGIKKKIDHSVAILEQAIKGLQEDIEDASHRAAARTIEVTANAPTENRQVFVVHGHDEGARESVARFLEKIDLKPVILHERANKGRTLITKFREESADIGFAVVLMTPDDQGGKAGKANTQPRARQNVVFELGFFIGALGPERVAALVKGDIERPSDFDGVVYIDLDAAGGWKQQLGRELQAAGFHIDWNKVMSCTNLFRPLPVSICPP